MRRRNRQLHGKAGTQQHAYAAANKQAGLPQVCLQHQMLPCPS